MIRVNLLPGGKKGTGPSRFAFSMPDMGGLPTDKWTLSAIVLGILGVGAVAYIFTTTSSRVEDLTVQVEEAVQDSIRFAELIEQTQRLQAQRDSIGEKVAIIQEIDQTRYVWPHIMDEVAEALPDFTWLSGIVQVALGERPTFQISGRAGNNFAITRFMENLEASPFIRDVELLSSVQVTQAGEDDIRRLVNQFQIEATYEEPPMELLETVPLFGTETGEGDVTSPSSSGAR